MIGFSKEMVNYRTANITKLFKFVLNKLLINIKPIYQDEKNNIITRI
ncbi:hypothetical protein DFQ08_102138 [Winogradskyella arenosi]|uniref:Uncharacterized protein n=1 Tax=Winogradskyella arenosi TaxID=533325 RepID=A0A368ZHK1_9FLAO|nr:hypothetical protein DFQ08_102138 [Winogradskyella arenosi]